MIYADENITCCQSKHLTSFGVLLLAEKALNIGVRDIAFDRSGYKYHGRIKALADAAREGGLKF